MTSDFLKRPGIAGAAFGVVVFVVYLLTLAPSVSFIDAGELAAVAHTFGIAHPTGYPLFTMLGGLWSMLPLGDVIFRMNLFAAALCAASAAVMVRAILYLLGLAPMAGKSVPRKKPVARKSSAQPVRKSAPAPVFSDTERLAIALFGAAVIAFSQTFWATAVAIEVYSLHLLFLALLLWMFPPLVFAPAADARAWTRSWLAFAFTLGLAFTNHMTTVLLAPAFLYAFFRRFGLGADAWKRVGLAVPAFIAGLLPYLYLPLRAAASPAYNWGNPVTWETFIRHITGKQFQVWMFSGSEAAQKQLGVFVTTFPAEFGYALVVPILIGAFAMVRRHRQAGVFALVLFVSCVLYSINYNINDIESYFLLAYVVAGVWAAFGLRWILERVKPAMRMPALGGGVLLIGVLLGVEWPQVTESGDHLVEDYTKNMFNSLKPNALVISFQWDFWVSASYYYQSVEGLRPDVVVIDKELLRRSWYLEQLRVNHPEIYRRSEKEIDAFREQLLLFEREQPYSAALIEERYNAMINSFITYNYGDRPVYLTIEMEKQFAPGYVRVPEGLAERLYRPDAVPPPAAPVWDDFTYRPFARHGRLPDALRSLYAQMLMLRGNLLARAGMYDEAERYFTRADGFTPGNAEIQDALGRVRQAKRTATL